MYFIDFHTHVYPDAIAPKAADSIRKFYHLGDDYMDGRVETLLKYGDQAGVEKFVILPVSLRPTNTRHIMILLLMQYPNSPVSSDMEPSMPVCRICARKWNTLCRRACWA